MVLHGFAISGMLQAFHSMPELCNGFEQMCFATATDALSRGFLEISARHQLVKETHATEEFEKQLYAAFDGGDNLQRLPLYEIQATEDEVQVCKECFRDRFRYPTWALLEHGQERKRQEKGRPWCCPGIKSPMRPVLEERCSCNARGNLFRRTCFKNASLSGVASRWEDLTVSCSGGDRADTCEFAEQAMAARESNALWSVGNPTARLLPGVHKRIRCPRVRVSRCYSSGAAQTGWPRKTEVCSVFCDMDPL